MEGNNTEFKMDQFLLRKKKNVQFGTINEAFEPDEDEERRSPTPNTERINPDPIPAAQPAAQPTWDCFQETPADNFDNNNIFFNHTILILLKVLVGMFLFLFVLGTALFSRLTFLEMVQQLQRVNITLPLGKEQQKKCHENEILPAKNFSGFQNETGNGLPYERSELQVSWIWAMFLVVCFPYFMGVLKSLWRMAFKKVRPISKTILFWIICMETLHSLGLLMLTFIVLPNIDPVRSSMLIYGVGLIPCLMNTIPKREIEAGMGTICFSRTGILRCLWKVVLLAATVITTVLLVFLYKSLNGDVLYATAEKSALSSFWTKILIIAPVSLALISAKYWRLYSGKFCSAKSERRIDKQRTNIALLVSTLKIVYTLVFLYVFYGTGSKACGSTLFAASKNATSCGFQKITLLSTDRSPWPFYYALANLITGFCCFRFAGVACQLLLQRLSFALPLLLTGPLSTLLVLVFTSQGLWFFKMAPKDSPSLIERDLVGFLGCYFQEFTWERIYVFGFYLLFVFITRHTWNNGEKLAKDHKLFTSTVYCGVLLDQSILLSRRRHVKEAEKRTEDPSQNRKYSAEKLKRLKKNTLIYACATMWHENENEMMQLLKSIFRMNLHQYIQTYMKDHLGAKIENYYLFEAHIFFDDAFRYDEETESYTINNYVRQLMKCVPKACTAVIDIFDLGPPKKVLTPYGGQLIWELPGGNKMVAHLKHAKLIRPKKRWSQVMYMYYFLGKLIYGEQVKASVHRVRAENTFLLALDGDVDFEPSAVLLLVDRMKRNPKVGAACGRIHPIGTGPMVWYQKFEYAISHWLQKATEHMIGCVLCSPGCFSLFKGSALASENVLKRYTTVPTEAKHKVQYDQGEDRWLCTLLLQQGYRVEYCAASDALTYCPETFTEFFKQRRRWAPSTMANIMDLLMDWRNVRQKNDSISMLYIAYQMGLMVTSIITPGTILMLIVGALSQAYEIVLWKSFVINLIPVILMMLLCIYTKEDTQLQYASIMSLLYAVMMMIVMIGLLNEIGTFLFCSATTVLFTFVVGCFLLSALCHPKEFFCIIHGLLYFVLIPSMSMMLMFYALGNLQNVSWGTRDSEAEKEAKLKAEKIAQDGAKVDPTTTTTTITTTTTTTDDDSDNIQEDRDKDNCSDNAYVYNDNTDNGDNSNREDIAQSQKRNKAAKTSTTDNSSNSLDSDKDNRGDNTNVGHINNTNDTNTNPEGNAQPEKRKKGAIERFQNLFDIPGRGRATEENSEYSFSCGPVFRCLCFPKETATPKMEEKKSPLAEQESERKLRQIAASGEWMSDKDMKNLDEMEIDEEEKSFWRGLIDQYLSPDKNDEETRAKEKKMKENLAELRNNVCLFFYLINTLFVIVVFTIEYKLSNSQSTSFHMPCQDDDVKPKETNAITVVFMVVFGITLAIQLLAMLLHRLETLLHILAAIEIRPNQISHNHLDGLIKSLRSSSGSGYDPSDVESQCSGVSGSTEAGDTRVVRRHKRAAIFRRPTKVKSFEELMDNRFSVAFDNLSGESGVMGKKYRNFNEHMSWIMMLQDPEVKSKAAEYREKIRGKWVSTMLKVTERKPDLRDIVRLAQRQNMRKPIDNPDSKADLLPEVKDSSNRNFNLMGESLPNSPEAVDEEGSVVVPVSIHPERKEHLKRAFLSVVKDSSNRNFTLTGENVPHSKESGEEDGSVVVPVSIHPERKEQVKRDLLPVIENLNNRDSTIRGENLPHSEESVGKGKSTGFPVNMHPERKAQLKKALLSVVKDSNNRNFTVTGEDFPRSKKALEKEDSTTVSSSMKPKTPEQQEKSLLSGNRNFTATGEDLLHSKKALEKDDTKAVSVSMQLETPEQQEKSLLSSNRNFIFTGENFPRSKKAPEKEDSSAFPVSFHHETTKQLEKALLSSNRNFTVTGEDLLHSKKAPEKEDSSAFPVSLHRETTETPTRGVDQQDFCSLHQEKSGADPDDAELGNCRDNVDSSIAKKSDGNVTLLVDKTDSNTRPSPVQQRSGPGSGREEGPPRGDQNDTVVQIEQESTPEANGIKPSAEMSASGTKTNINTKAKDLFEPYLCDVTDGLDSCELSIEISDCQSSDNEIEEEEEESTAL